MAVRGSWEGTPRRLRPPGPPPKAAGGGMGAPRHRHPPHPRAPLCWDRWEPVGVLRVGDSELPPRPALRGAWGGTVLSGPWGSAGCPQKRGGSGRKRCIIIIIIF